VWVPALLGLGWIAVAAGAVDLRDRRLPDALTLPAFPVALLLLLPVGPAAVVRGAAGAAVAVAVHLALHLVDRRAVGAGDVKLAAPLGAVLAGVALPALALAAVLAACFTALLAVAGAIGSPAPTGIRVPASVQARAGPERRWRLAGRAVPHGPSMLAATWVVTLALLALGAGSG
jgi:leader peptidase (prepilin peptidase)/N-methyltransferase